MANDLGRDPLEVGAVKLDNDLAAALVRKIGGFDPSRLQVFPVALVKRGEKWAAAPVPASFENTGVGYAATLRPRIAALEDWMLREKALDLENLREQSAAHTRRKVEESLPSATLRNFTSSQAAERFLKACEQRNLLEILGLLGGLSDTLPDDWALRLNATETAVTGGDEVKPPWRLLISPDVLRVPVHHEEDGGNAQVSIACIDPAGTSSVPRVEFVHLELAKTREGFWRIDLPGHFLQNDENASDDADEDLDSDLLEAFPAKLAGRFPPSPKPTLEQAMQALLSALHGGNLCSLAPLIRPEDDPAAARRSYLRAARTWWALHDRRALPLAVQEYEKIAGGAFQCFSSRNPDQLDLKILYFEKSTDGWFWCPEPRPQTKESFREWTDLQAKRWPDEWQDTLLADCQVLEKIPESGAPPVDQASEVVENWLQATRAGDVMAAIRLTARLNTPDSRAALLRNLGYEMTGTRQGPPHHHRGSPQRWDVDRRGRENRP